MPDSHHLKTQLRYKKESNLDLEDLKLKQTPHQLGADLTLILLKTQTLKAVTKVLRMFLIEEKRLRKVT